MVKRTLVVLAILSLIVATAGTSFAFLKVGGWTGWQYPMADPTYVPVDCPPCPDWVPVVKTWSKTYVTPAPCGPVGGAVAANGFDPGLRGAGIAAIMTPFDALFGGMGGVYGCGLEFGGGPCGPFFGPLPFLLVGPARLLAAPTLIFGTLW